MTTTTLTVPRAATAEEITAAGWIVDGPQIQSPVTLAWYMLDAMRVAEYRTDPATGERERGPWIYLDDEGPCAEWYCVRLDPRALYDAAEMALVAAQDADDTDALDRATVRRDAAVDLMIEHDTPRPWRLIEEGYHHDTITAGSAEEALDEARDRVDRVNYDGADAAATLYIDVSVRCVETDERADATVTLEPDEPECSADEHDWRSPIEVVGGCRESPGVHGHGGGVTIDEVCAHCGTYRKIDTWAQRRDTGEQGLTETSYRDADVASITWLRRRALDRAQEILDALDCVVLYCDDPDSDPADPALLVDLIDTTGAVATLEAALGEAYEVGDPRDDDSVRVRSHAGPR